MALDIARPKVALIGRPNVGKSTLFNRLIGRAGRRGGRAAIVHELPGVTRDRLYGVCEWDGYEFTVIDCGGIGPESEDPLWEDVADNARVAMAEAELVLFMTDARTGMTLSDEAVLKELRKLKRPVIVAVNKVDSEKHEPDAYEFYGLGYTDVAFVSAASGRGSGDLLGLIVERLDWTAYPQATPEFARQRYSGADEVAPAGDEDVGAPPVEAEHGAGGRRSAAQRRADSGHGTADDVWPEDEDYPFAFADTTAPRFVPDESWRDTPLRLVFAGRQNVGKSSLTNSLLGQYRALVSDLPGTTRDPLFARFEHDGQRFELLDTAGLKRLSRIKESVDFYSLVRAEKGLAGSEVALLTLDAALGVSEQDKRVAAKIAELKRAVVVIVNKADLLPTASGAGTTQLRLEAPALAAYTDYVRGQLDELRFAEIVFTSATAGSGLSELLAAAQRARENFHRRVDNTVLREVWQEAISLSPPPVVKNRELRFTDFRQIGNCPPAFLIEVSEKAIMRGAYLRYLENTLRRQFDFSGTHVTLVLYEKRRKR